MGLQRSSYIYEEFYYSKNHFHQEYYLKTCLIGLDCSAKGILQKQAMGKAIVKLAELVLVINERIDWIYDLVMNSLMVI